MSTDPAPLSTGDVLGEAGVPVSLTFRGRPHPVSPPVPRVIDRVEKLVAFRANAAANDLADALPPADAAALKASVLADLKARQHATGGTLWAAEFGADGGQRGTHLMLFACLEDAREQAKDPTALPPPIPFDDMADVLAESPDAAAVVAVMLPDFLRAAGKRRKFPAATVERMVAQAVRSLKAASPPT